MTSTRRTQEEFVCHGPVGRGGGDEKEREKHWNFLLENVPVLKTKPI